MLPLRLLEFRHQFGFQGPQGSQEGHEDFVGGKLHDIHQLLCPEVRAGRGEDLAGAGLGETALEVWPLQNDPGVWELTDQKDSQGLERS